jgi:hypothetical protein
VFDGRGILVCGVRFRVRVRVRSAENIAVLPLKPKDENLILSKQRKEERKKMKS